MVRESLVVDGTAKTCKGVIAGLERGMSSLAPGEVVLAIVGDIPTRIDVYAWTQRKSHRVLEERRHGSGFLFYIAKGVRASEPRSEEMYGSPGRTEGERAETALPSGTPR